MMPDSDCSQQKVPETSQQIFWSLHSENNKMPFGLVFKPQPILWKKGKENKWDKASKQASHQQRKEGEKNLQEQKKKCSSPFLAPALIIS